MTDARYLLAGAALDSGNRGVEALARSTLFAIERYRPGSTVTVLDNGWGVRPAPTELHPALRLELAGVRVTRRWHRPESWARIALSQRLRPLPNPVASRFSMADAVLDASGGDSFTDLYGEHRFAQTIAPKQAAVRAGAKLVLMPQTYGPFTDRRLREVAAALVRSATVAFSRDADSHDVLLDLAGEAADFSRLREGVDVAFALPAQDPGKLLPREVWTFIENDDGRPLAGINVSGLLWHHGQLDDVASSDYASVVEQVVARIAGLGARVLLVAHVTPSPGAGESDVTAIAELLDRLPEGVRRSVTAAPASLSATQLKWLIGRCDWFWGARMHATIAALSMNVAAAATAYSPKTAGVFATCGVRDHVVDGRTDPTDATVERLLELFEARETTAARLRATVPPVVQRAHDQLRDLLTTDVAIAGPVTAGR